MVYKMITVSVPATTANVGSGFDSIGIALDMYNTISVETISSGLHIKILDDTRHFLPKDERNLVYRAMKRVFEIADYHPSGIRIIQKNNIPVTRGLGSSSASIVGGLVAANELCGKRLSQDKIIELAAELEGHPDNSTPAIVGGMAIAVQGKNGISYIKLPINRDKLLFALLIPNFILRTKKARSVLPNTVSHHDAVFNTGRAALLTASIATTNYEHIAVALEDRLHQPYREGLIKGAEDIFAISRDFGALGSYISGAGPTIVAIIKAEQKEKFYNQMNSFLKNNMPDWAVNIVAPNNVGALIKRN